MPRRMTPALSTFAFFFHSPFNIRQLMIADNYEARVRPFIIGLNVIIHYFYYRYHMLVMFGYYFIHAELKILIYIYLYIIK